MILYMRYFPEKKGISTGTDLGFRKEGIRRVCVTGLEDIVVLAGSNKNQNKVATYVTKHHILLHFGSGS